MNNHYTSVHVIAQTVIENFSIEITRDIIRKEVMRILDLYPAFNDIDIESLIDQL